MYSLKLSRREPQADCGIVNCGVQRAAFGPWFFRSLTTLPVTAVKETDSSSSYASGIVSCVVMLLIVATLDFLLCRDSVAVVS